MFLTLQQIKKSFGQGESKVEVLKGIDLAVEQGEFCVLLGPSGSGKSTLLNIIGGIDRADDGEIVIHGERISYPEVSSNELRSDGPSSRIRTSCCAMSRQVRWTIRHPRRS